MAPRIFLYYLFTVDVDRFLEMIMLEGLRLMLRQMENAFVRQSAVLEATKAKIAACKQAIADAEKDQPQLPLDGKKK